FELADGGTRLLDEIGELNASTQIKLLRAIQEREFERLGGTETIKVNVRLIAATNKELEGAIAAGEFREDLYYRLNVFSIFMPPLRERKPDVLLLADHLLEKYGLEHGKASIRISTASIDMLTSYHWPGNVRELENIIELAVVVCAAHVTAFQVPAEDSAAVDVEYLARDVARPIGSKEEDGQRHVVGGRQTAQRDSFHDLSLVLLCAEDGIIEFRINPTRRDRVHAYVR